ncbi:N-acetylglucosamine/diacetylchitobiose ABC transporter substrate-binding protein [Spirilliplanes yamanashiensis]|uniref:Carbohydrate ABC transporter, N-acetylglucosamine/diacetylchitobiose-binding protein n=1 Tax=Spirilliplanes yamanashiensis TaxID=42233 RepID=A0A8J4DJB6_9ACTN|nr:N-acetylglucosamine/diacetylchitobiose ABC transporter substrate-binding protein [Spirilliplanes yamanashiensis]MDP9817168.1 N-acetylglucosamine transport system substrate-binding protein [Spirilliplanes yamanashiensis]GIJ03179.1 carbohydrate ABC transporter, N-acetylglucosamine/diacetylchitobiose-binding protein [Spirilliplanes yamanashiensis]
MAEIPGTGTELDRRTVLRRAAMAGLLATPAMGLLNACASGGDEGANTDTPSGEKSDTNPLGVDPKAPLEVVIFNGGLGTKYATDVHIPSYNKLFPESKVTFSQTEEIATVIQPRVNAGDPPDMINNSGSKLMDMGALVQAGQAQDLTELFAAPSVDIAGSTVKDTLVPGTVEQGQFNGKPYALNYAFTVFGLWYNSKLFAANNWTAPKTWAEFTALLDQIKGKGILPYSYAGANASYYQYLVILTSAAKIGGPDVLKNIDNLADGAWQAPAVKQAAQAWGEIGAKYGNKAHLGLKHTEVQLQQNQDKVAIYPSGSWLENEQAKDTPAGFEYAVMPVPSVTGSDAMPQTAIYAAAGEIYFVAAKGKNPRGGMEYLRHMLSKAGAQGFTKATKVLTVVKGATDGLTISPGLTSSDTMLKAAGADYFSYRFDTWYKKLDDEARAATNELMFSGGDAQKFCDRMQKAADAVKADSSIQKFTR